MRSLSTGTEARGCRGDGSVRPQVLDVFPGIQELIYYFEDP